MNKSVGGLNAQSFALENISGNIANSQTTAFKRTDTSFQDLIQSGGSKVSSMAAGNVKASGRSTVNLQGSVEANATETFMAVKGSGYFSVRQKAGEVDGATTFTNSTAYTRRGDFQLDREGYLVNQSGYYLAGLAIDPATGNPTGDTPDVIQINNNPIPAEVTTEVTYRLNLPKSPLTTNARNNPTTANSELWAPTAALMPSGPEANVSGTAAVDDFINNSISGGAVTAYDAAGSPVNMQIRWAKLSNTTGNHEWGMYYLSNSSAATPQWTYVNSFTFDDAGAMTVPAAPATTISLGTVSVDGVSLGTSPVTMNFSTREGITQFADTTGKTNVRQLVQDGLPAGNFTGVSISDGGRVVAQYSNGKTMDIYQIPLVEFSGESWLRPVDGGAYMETKESGPPINNTSGLVVGSALESSNVDIGEEFTKLIVTQQAFSANSRVITTADQMLSDVINIIR